MADESNKDFDSTFDDIKDDEQTDIDDPSQVEKDRSYHMLQSFHSDVGTKLDSEWSEAEGLKVFTERRNIRDLRQYRGMYDPEILQAIHPNRSKAFIRLTRTKVKTFDARMHDTQFPANDDKNWVLNTTPVPEISPKIVQTVAEQMLSQNGTIPTEAEVEDVIGKIADSAAKAMEKEIADQLTEFDYRAVIREVIHSGNIYGTGILKGPMVKEVTAKRWHQNPNTGEWQQVKLKRIIPTAQSVSIWDIYPDMSAKWLKDARYVWQKHLFTKNRFSQLGKRADFNSEAVKAIMDVHPGGNATYKHYEEFLRDMSSNSRTEGDTNPPKLEKYEVHERWGYLDIEEAKKLLPNVDDETWEQYEPEVACNIWLVGGIIIKAVLSPVEGSAIPYYFYYFDKDETSIFGDGLPSIMRDPQQLYNASVRAMLDNAAISAGPIIEANIEMLADGENPLDVFPFRVFQRTGTGIDANQAAIRVNKMPSYTKEFLSLVSFFQDTADESTTVPRSLHGASDMGSGAAAKTATGMSMLIGASNITLKDQVQFFDDGITKPFIRAMYFWNMEFNPKDNIKGDFNIVARGSKSLIAKEVKMEQINQFLALTNNDTDLQYIKRDVLLRELAEIFDLDRLGFIRTAAEVAAGKEQNAAAAKREQDFNMVLEAFKAQSSGHAPDAVEQTIKLFNIQLPGMISPQDPNQIQQQGLNQQ